MSEEAKVRADQHLAAFHTRAALVAQYWPHRVRAVRNRSEVGFEVAYWPGEFSPKSDEVLKDEKQVVIPSHFKQLWKWGDKGMPPGFRPTRGRGPRKDWVETVSCDPSTPNSGFNERGEMLDCFDPVVILGYPESYQDLAAMRIMERLYRVPSAVRGY